MFSLTEQKFGDQCDQFVLLLFPICIIYLYTQHILLHKINIVLYYTHTALYIFEFWQDIKSETISLASGSISTIHEIPKGKNQTQDLLHCFTVLQRLYRKEVDPQL